MPHPGRFEDLLAGCFAAARAPLSWSAGALRGLTAPTLLVIGDTDCVRVERAAGMQRLIPRPAALPATTRMTLMRRTSLFPPPPDEFLG
ncbi:hypothetical protein ACFYQA_19885 [Streptomyces sp. NPDC005774]|uniref:hypothetical protein n=1 Tax=Streptomyces sp. NPDC005774 TaxID=3364728 RepID=UPI003690E175